MNNRSDKDKEPSPLSLSLLEVDKRLADMKKLKQQSQKLREELGQDELALKLTNPEFQKALATVTSYGGALQYLKSDYKKDKDIVLAAVKSYGKALIYADDELKKNRDIVLAAVKSSGLALEYADDELKKDRDIVLAAIESDGETLMYSPIFYGSHGQPPMKLYDFGLTDLDEAFKKDKKILLAAIKRDAQNFNYAVPELQNNKNFVLEVLQTNGLALEYIDGSFTINFEVNLAAVKQNPHAIMYVENNYQKKIDLMLVAAKIDADVLKYMCIREKYLEFTWALWRIGNSQKNNDRRIEYIYNQLLEQLGFLLPVIGLTTLGILWFKDIIPKVVNIIGLLVAIGGVMGIGYFLATNAYAFFKSNQRLDNFYANECKPLPGSLV